MLGYPNLLDFTEGDHKRCNVSNTGTRLMCKERVKEITSLFLAAEVSDRSMRTIHSAKRNMIRPCPKSPNMTAKRKGNEMIVNGAVKTNTRKYKHNIQKQPLHTQKYISKCLKSPNLYTRFIIIKYTYREFRFQCQVANGDVAQAHVTVV